jgi:hypothetical protein
MDGLLIDFGLECASTSSPPLIMESNEFNLLGLETGWPSTLSTDCNLQDELGQGQGGSEQERVSLRADLYRWGGGLFPSVVSGGRDCADRLDSMPAKILSAPLLIAEDLNTVVTSNGAGKNIIYISLLEGRAAIVLKSNCATIFLRIEYEIFLL